jgi:hypothetical protein
MQKEQLSLWRVPAPVVAAGKYSSVILDRGELKKAVADSKGNYLLSQTGAGIQSMVLVGTPLQIADFLLAQQARKIDNQIKQLPQIYMGISLFKPKARFSGLFPVGDAWTQVLTYLTKFVPGNVWTDIGGIPGSLKEIKAAIGTLSDKQKQTGDILYVKFSYLPEDGMKQIASKQIDFGQVLAVFQKEYKR